MLGILQNRRRSTQGAARRSELGRAISFAADFANVAVLIGRGTARAGATDVAIGEKTLIFFAEELRQRALLEQAGSGKPSIDLVGIALVDRMMGAVKTVEADGEA